MEGHLQAALKAIAAVEKTIDKEVELPATGSWQRSVHLFDQKSLWAIKAGLTAERPLLVRGEPGTGKSQFARAAARVLGRAFLSEVVHARSECQDLQFTYDAVSRLGEAQALGAAGVKEVKTALNPLNFLSPGILWWAFDWADAAKQHARCCYLKQKPAVPPGWEPARGCVVLIDEIDKADIELPNGLLETLGNGAFSVPFALEKEVIGLAPAVPPPLVIITTNEERELPPAFVRRCLVLYLELPKEEKDCIPWLLQRGAVHFRGSCTPGVMEEAARQLWKNRAEALQQGVAAPGQAEYLDMLRILSRISQDEGEQLAALEAVRDFALKKNPQENY